MAIENRDLAAGTKISARYKGKTHTAEVVKAKDGIVYRLDGTNYSSPSSAGRAVTGGVAVNGWRFWSLDGDLKAARAKGEAKAAKKAPAKKASKKKSAKKGKATRAASKSDAYGCGVCGETFPTLKAATKHAGEAHLS